jgi:hypothetical protein
MNDSNARPVPWRRWLVYFVLTLLVLPPVIFAVWAWGSLHFVYARGERSGFVQKISLKGWACKTWEGELAMANLPGTMPQIFYFTVPSTAVANQITQSIGQRVALSYDEHRGIPSTCFGETQHFVTAVRVAPADGSVPAALASPTAVPNT